MKLLLIVLSAAVALAQTPTARPNPNADPETIPLWENGAPGALGNADTDHPTLIIFRGASRPNGGTSVIIAPGGGYTNLAIDTEGRQIASWFNAIGVTAFVLKYRLGPRYHHPIELGNVQRAIRLARSRAAQFGIALNRIGIMGVSAGGHLAATAETRFNDGNPGAADSIDRARSRPDFFTLAYPVISIDPAIAHAGFVRSLLGENPAPRLLEGLSADRHVTAQTPPTFLLSTNAGTAVPSENTVRFNLALRRAAVPAEIRR